MARPLEGIAKQMRVSGAFLRLCGAVGFPMENGMIRAGELLLWLFDHYEDVRAAAGLEPLASVEGVAPQTMARLRMSNALVTLLEFSRMRATNWRQKRQLRRAMESVILLSDHVG